MRATFRIPMTNGQVRLSLMEDNKEKYHAIVSMEFSPCMFDDIKRHWEQTGQKPYGFVSEGTKTL